jgi:hypothetical protein
MKLIQFNPLMLNELTPLESAKFNYYSICERNSYIYYEWIRF